ncbi:ribosome maturation factor RimM [Clostridium tertium]|jgi:16S rRNA processing protein RimM|uniref:Ribosome maturation factor RimM n=1 Tax=Clostridium tertium TaxID=1559 RepID=A0A9X4AYR8_9CLOT|nr:MULTISPECIES: ribosome maturation factor RimM [Clostridium]EEH98160.1 16S rRNA processing protein RimM [Clostridium sp. 7_2_43FAA]MBP1866991.1 16S rRNA processing protein RimM [Clostridium tertium]MBS5305205.1 16S rRNA processing protein RimM [Clostridium sp.]MBS5883440.1 16S rRNA processing protein RimM [Clostridium sp.]MBS6501144.1 16S rRNA processing protein RimM [Clostridium sp.]
MRDILRVGKIVNTHGLKGEVKVIALTDDPKRYNDLDFVLIDGVERKIQGCKFQKDRVIVKIEGIDSIEEAEKYKNKYMEIPREYAVPLEEDTYYIADIIGCNVYDTEGKSLGEVYDVIQTKNNDVYWIRKPKELLIPVLLDIVTDIDVENRKITIKPVGEWQDED